MNTLSLTELEQLYWYLQQVEQTGEYYGYKKHFDTRHKKIKETLNKLIGLKLKRDTPLYG